VFACVADVSSPVASDSDIVGAHSIFVGAPPVFVGAPSVIVGIARNSVGAVSPTVGAFHSFVGLVSAIGDFDGTSTHRSRSHAVVRLGSDARVHMPTRQRRSEQDFALIAMSAPPILPHAHRDVE
jgi:hypothetical protein